MSKQQNIFSQNVIIPDLDQSNSSFELSERLSFKLNALAIGDFKNENVEHLNDAGIAQLQHLSQEGSVWKMCKEGLLNELKHKLENEPIDAVKKRGTFGETMLHIAILFKQSHIARYLISKYPLLIDAIYLNEEYYGETALHMAVINRDCNLTEYLLKHGANPNKGRATGRFFDRERGTVYYGEHALTFAISTFQCDIIELLHEHGANILNVYDSFGNSVFHHCVRVNAPKIFDTLIDLVRTEDKYFKMSSLNQIRNDDGQSVIQYAVELGKNEIFDHMLEKMKIIGWEWGDVSFFAYPITEIDTHGDNPHSVLETIITEHRCSFVSNPVIYEILMEKWQSYGQKIFILWFVLHIIYCILLTMTCLEYSFDDELIIMMSTSIPIWIKCTLFIICCKVLVMTIMELFEFQALIGEHGWKRAWHIYVASSILSVTGLFKLIAWCANISSLFAIVCIFILPQYDGIHHLLRGLMAFMLLCEWLHTLMFLQAFMSTGRLVVTISKILSKDVSRFVFIYGIILCAFSSSLSLITTPMENDSNWTHSMFILFELSLGMGNSNYFGKDISNPFKLALTQILYTIFLLLSVVLLFNLLIAIMTETTEEVRQQATEQYMLQWASTVLLIERRVPKCLYKRTGTQGIKFGFNSNGQQNHYFITFTQTKQFHTDNVVKNFRQSMVVTDL